MMQGYAGFSGSSGLGFRGLGFRVFTLESLVGDVGILCSDSTQGSARILQGFTRHSGCTCRPGGRLTIPENSPSLPKTHVIQPLL